MSKVKLTMLNSMGDGDFIKTLDKHQELNIKAMDLKDSVFGKSLIDLTDEDATRANELMTQKNITTYCFSTVLFHLDIEVGEEEFRKQSLDKVGRIIELARIMKPEVIRLLAAKSTKRSEYSNIIPYIKSNTPWLIPMYREAIEKINAAGFGVTIENEAHACIFSNPEEILEFFKELNCEDKVSFTYDIQNLWQMGTFPTVESYKKLAPITGYFHLKGGQSHGGNELEWRSSLEDATWPVKEIVELAINENISKYFCLNPSHGKIREGYNNHNITKRDIDFLRRNFDGIE